MTSCIVHGMKILPLLLAAAALGGAGRDVRQPLFVIERNTNANVVQYDANLQPDGRIDPRCPVQAYWIMAAQDGRREELNAIERAKAYGFTVAPAAVPQAYRVELVAQKQRPIEVFRQGDSVRAETTIAGHRAYLNRIYVTAHKVLAVPSVKSIEWFGTDVATNQAVHETVMP